MHMMISEHVENLTFIKPRLFLFVKHLCLCVIGSCLGSS